MEITLVRHKLNGKNTIGRMLVDGKFFAHTCEDVYRHLRTKEDKVYGKTAIPYGTYRVIISESKRFKKELPLLLDVPFFAGVRIHGGNTEADTEGCILVGAETDEKKIWNCGTKVRGITELIREAMLRGEDVFIQIKPEFEKI